MDPSWSLLQFQEVRLECDTTTAPVTINLPKISDLAQSTNLKLVIVDVTANASTNNITINSDGPDTFDDDTTTTTAGCGCGGNKKKPNVETTKA